MKIIYGFLLILLLGLNSARAADILDLAIHDQDIQVSRHAADGEHLMVWVMPRLSETPRVAELAGQVAARGIEVWLVDLADSLFLPSGPATQRSIDGRYVSGLVNAAHRDSGKTITLMARGYAAIPVLKGARDWQQREVAAGRRDPFLAGVVLVSPDLYATIPALGLDPVYEAVTSATNMPIMLYQSGKRGNRWQLDRLLETLQVGGARVYFKILPGVTGLFSDNDRAPATLQALADFPAQLAQSLALLKRLPTPLKVVEMKAPKPSAGLGLDTRLTPFRGNMKPIPLDLIDAGNGQRVRREHYRDKVTVMNFWASWCPPCVEEIPSLNRLRQLMANQPFELISINYAEDRARIEKFLRDVKVDFPVLLDSDGRYSAGWNVLVFPSTFVIGPEGRIVYGVNGAIHWDDAEVVQQLRALLPGHNAD